MSIHNCTDDGSYSIDSSRDSDNSNCSGFGPCCKRCYELFRPLRCTRGYYFLAQLTLGRKRDSVDHPTVAGFCVYQAPSTRRNQGVLISTSLYRILRFELPVQDNRVQGLLCVCVYIYICACAHVCMYVCMYVCM